MNTKLTQDWQEVKLEEISQIDSGQGAPQGENWFTGNNVFVRAGDLNKLSEGVFVGDYCEKITDNAIKKYSLTLYHKNSVVFPKSGMSIATENIAILKYDSYVVNHLAIIATDNLIDSKYIFYFLKKLKILNLVRNQSYPSIRISDIKNLKILWPSKEIRREIVSILEKAEKLKELREEADKLTKDYLKAVFLDMFGDPVKNPKKWKKLPLNGFGHIVTGNTPPRKNKENYGDYIDWIKSDNLNTPHTYTTKSVERLSEKGSKIGRVVPKGSVLVTCIAGSISSIGNAAIADKDVAFNQQINAIIPKNGVDSFYLYYLIKNSQEIIQNTSTKALKGIVSKSKFSSIELPLPVTSLQYQFAKMAKEIERMKEYQKQSKEHIENLFSKLMQKSFKGELAC